MTSVIQVYFYTKDGCHLCEKMALDLQAFIDAKSGCYQLEIIMRDIDDNSAWHEHFWEYIPALVINDEEVCNYFFDAEEFESYLNKLVNK